jgi:hypothetical protein
MCPVCIATAVLIAGAAGSTGGLTAFAAKQIRAKGSLEKPSAPTQSKEDEHGYQHC